MGPTPSNAARRTRLQAQGGKKEVGEGVKSVNEGEIY